MKLFQAFQLENMDSPNKTSSAHGQKMCVLPYLYKKKKSFLSFEGNSNSVPSLPYSSIPSSLKRVR